MPIYEYECTDCGNRFEALIRGNEKPECPACEGGNLEKLMSASATHARSGSPTDCACEARQAGACQQTGCPGGCCHNH